MLVDLLSENYDAGLEEYWKNERAANTLIQHGTMEWSLLQGYGIESVAGLKTLKEHGSLYESYPLIATRGLSIVAADRI